MDKYGHQDSILKGGHVKIATFQIIAKNEWKQKQKSISSEINVLHAWLVAPIELSIFIFMAQIFMLISHLSFNILSALSRGLQGSLSALSQLSLQAA